MWRGRLRACVRTGRRNRKYKSYLIVWCDSLTFMWRLRIWRYRLTLYAIKIVPDFTRYSRNIIKRDVESCATVSASNFLGMCSCQKLVTSDEIWQRYRKNKRVNFFETHAIIITLWVAPGRSWFGQSDTTPHKWQLPPATVCLPPSLQAYYACIHTRTTFNKHCKHADDMLAAIRPVTQGCRCRQ